MASARMRRLAKELKNLERQRNPQVTVRPSSKSFLEWHFVLHHLPADSVYKDGYYHGKVVFPEQYPFAPPALYMLTPNGRFLTDQRLCLCETDFRPESWNPAWTVESILVNLISFMVDVGDPEGYGVVHATANARSRLAGSSLEFNRRSREFQELFPEFAYSESAVGAEDVVVQILPGSDADPQRPTGEEEAGLDLGLAASETPALATEDNATPIEKAQAPTAHSTTPPAESTFADACTGQDEAEQAAGEEEGGQGALECWICYKDGSQEPLIQPCACRGSMSGVHASCVEAWINHHRASVPWGEMPKCPVCHQAYLGTESRPGMVKFAVQLPNSCSRFVLGGLFLFLVTGMYAEGAMKPNPHPTWKRLILVTPLGGVFLHQSLLLAFSCPFALGRPPPKYCGRFFFNPDPGWVARVASVMGWYLALGAVLCGAGLLELLWFLPFCILPLLPLCPLAFGMRFSLLAQVVLLLVFSPFLLIWFTVKEPRRLVDPADALLHLLVAFAIIPVCWFVASRTPVLVVIAAHCTVLGGGLVEKIVVKKMHWKAYDSWWVLIPVSAMSTYNLVSSYVFLPSTAEGKALVLAASLLWFTLVTTLALLVTRARGVRQYRTWQNRNASFHLQREAPAAGAAAGGGGAPAEVVGRGEPAEPFGGGALLPDALEDAARVTGPRAAGRLPARSARIGLCALCPVVVSLMPFEASCQLRVAGDIMMQQRTSRKRSGEASSGHQYGAKKVDTARLPLRTKGRYIVDSWGERVKWACVNWYGAYSTTHTVGGLEVRPIQEIVDRIASLGFNCVRMMYSVQGYVHNPNISQEALAANPDLWGMRFLEVFDLTIKLLTDAGLMIIVNNHNSKSGWCCHFSQDEGLWYVPEYTEQQWMDSLLFFTERYKDNPLVVAIDLRNEVHDYKETHLTWGDGNPRTDWAAAATRAGNAVLRVNPDVLIVVMALCFGADLRPMKSKPLELMYPHKIVYETHNYLEFQIFDNVSKMIKPWKYIRTWVAAVLFILVSALVLKRMLWVRLGKPMPPLGSFMVSLGLWIAGCAGVVLVILWFVYDFAMNFCSFMAYLDIVPCIVGTAAVAGLSLLVALFGSYHTALVAGLLPPAPCLPGRSSRLKARARQYQVPTVIGQATPIVAQPRSEAPDLGIDGLAGTGRGAHNADPPHSKGRRSKVRAFLDASYSPGFGSCTEARSLLRKLHEPPEKFRARPYVPWDLGLCCCLQLGICTVILTVLLVTLYIFAHLFPTYHFMSRYLDNMWGFALMDGYPTTAPVWMGEFGQEARGTYWLNFARYLAARDVDFAYWAINGLKWTEGKVNTLTGQFEPFDEPRWTNETFGVLEHDYWTVRHPWLMLDLQGLFASPSTWRPEDNPCDPEVHESCGG